MKEYHLNRVGDVDGIVLHNDAAPDSGAGRVVVRLHARSLNHRDLLILDRRYLLAGNDDVVPVSDGAGEKSRQRR